MSLATVQTFSTTDMRAYAFTADNFRDEYINHVFSNSPSLAIFVQQTLGDFGGVQLAGSGHTTESGGRELVIPVILGAHAGAKRATGPWDTHTVAPDDNARLAEAN